MTENEGRQYPGGENKDIIDEMRSSPISWVNLILVICNVGYFLFINATGDIGNSMYMIERGASYTPLIENGEYFRLISCIFIHFSWEHLFNNMILLFFVGFSLEQFIGSVRYAVVYLGGGIFANVVSLFLELAKHDNVISGGASGAVFAVLGGLVVVVVLNRGRIKGLSIQRLLLMIVLSIYVGFRSTGVDNAAHVGGVIGGALITALIYGFSKRRRENYDYYR